MASSAGWQQEHWKQSAALHMKSSTMHPQQNINTPPESLFVTTYSFRRHVAPSAHGMHNASAYETPTTFLNNTTRRRRRYFSSTTRRS